MQELGATVQIDIRYAVARSALSIDPERGGRCAAQLQSLLQARLSVAGSLVRGTINGGPQEREDDDREAVDDRANRLR